METAYCSSGKHEAPITEFWKRKNGIQPNCKMHQKILADAYYQNNKTSHKKNVAANKRKKLAIFREWKKTLSCSTKCGETYAKCLDFHHVGKDKDFELSNCAQNYGWSSILNELSKCVVVCKNCHTKIHDGVILTPTQKCDTSGLEQILTNNGIVV